MIIFISDLIVKIFTHSMTIVPHKKKCAIRSCLSDLRQIVSTNSNTINRATKKKCNKIMFVKSAPNDEAIFVVRQPWITLSAEMPIHFLKKKEFLLTIITIILSMCLI